MKLFITLFFLIACKSLPLESSKQSCTKKAAEVVADNFMIKKHYELSSYYKQINDSQNVFRIYYALKDSLTLGGDALIEVSKKNCSIIKVKLYQ